MILNGSGERFSLVTNCVEAEYPTKGMWWMGSQTIRIGTLHVVYIFALQAMSVNLHEFYKEDEPKKQSFYTNYYTFMFPQDVFSRSNLVLNKVG